MVFTAGPCDTGEISWTITDAAGATLASGGAASSTVGTCVSCTDGVQNGDETGVDCGGSCDCL